ncbi:MAG TPA: ATP-binding cassette domain-containing protein, partial [Spirochaetia bacterium]|nr:ATP-binding cassette domain-containing protein [Spirochaetia bacterium]
MSAPAESHVLEARGIVKRFGRKTVIRGVGFSMRSGEVVGLLGPNGAGKTTVFYTILGFLKPDQGAVILDDRDITRLPMYRRARLGVSYLPQEPSIFRRMTVEKNVWAILETRDDLSLEEKKERLEALLSEFGIQDIRRSSLLDSFGDK